MFGLLQNNSKYEITSETKAQMRFLSELDSLERKRLEDTERETLLRMAKVTVWPHFNVFVLTACKF